MNENRASASAPPPSDLPSNRRTLLLAGAGIAACTAGALGGYWWLNRGLANSGETAKLLAASFEDLNGQRVPMSSWRGKTLIANFWATWCGPCREEMPDFVKAQQEFGSKGLQFVGIAIDRKPAVERFVKELGINYPIVLGDVAWLDAVKTMGNPQGVLPFSLVFSPKGEVMLTRVGKLKYSEIAAIAA